MLVVRRVAALCTITAQLLWWDAFCARRLESKWEWLQFLTERKLQITVKSYRYASCNLNVFLLGRRPDSFSSTLHFALGTSILLKPYFLIPSTIRLHLASDGAHLNRACFKRRELVSSRACIKRVESITATYHVLSRHVRTPCFRRRQRPSTRLRPQAHRPSGITMFCGRSIETLSSSSRL
ncbi:hypothetical protein B0T20DRAFT_58899 [Sordaria brevicollis]|uniref:Secreted protein n=1 Tax=Sordaria brevicollis TaxID=83679 RepID=A0AAE0P325_SORBR|nr:hypothetical protein B0T20DRAFT_58899 [Sordaria brevicollis]